MDTVVLDFLSGNMGRPRVLISRDHLERLIEMDMSVTDISILLGVSRKTIHRRMREWDLSIGRTYSAITDRELDNLVLSVKENLANLGMWLTNTRDDVPCVLQLL